MTQYANVKIDNYCDTDCIRLCCPELQRQKGLFPFRFQCP